MTRRNTLEDCHELAERRGFIFLSNVYQNNHTPYDWQCKNGHIWPATYKDIRFGYGCPNCFRDKIRLKVKDCVELAKSKGGMFLSLVYKNNNIRYPWACNKGHVWFADVHHIKLGRWCPICGFRKAAKKFSRTSVLKHWKTKEDVLCHASYEKIVVEYFNTNKIDFLWQPKHFVMPNGKKYFPDCYLPEQDLWIEIKGWMRPVSKPKWDWFHREYPNSELWNLPKLKELGIL